MTMQADTIGSRTKDIAKKDLKPNKIENNSLRAAIALFFSYTSPRILAVALLAAWAIRLVIGEWSVWDAAVAAGIIAFWPIQEWLIHVFILHFKPIRIAGRTFDLHVAQKHRDHHQTPWHLPDVFIPLRSLITGVVIIPAIWFLIMPTTPLALSGIAVYLLFSLTYEWTHYLVHTSYKPKTRFYKRLWQHHRLHHFKNENLWYGVSMLSGDRILGTAPDHTEVETSPTCRTVLEKKSTQEA